MVKSGANLVKSGQKIVENVVVISHTRAGEQPAECRICLEMQEICLEIKYNSCKKHSLSSSLAPRNRWWAAHAGD